MTTSSAVRPPAALRAAAIPRDAALRLAATEYTRFAALLAALEPDEWTRPTDCTGWDVRAMSAHVLGMARMVASPLQFVRQNAITARSGGGIDALTALQVRDSAELSTAELADRTAAVGPAAVRGRRRLARVLGRLPLLERQVVGEEREWWSFGFLFDVILTRDTWMHRVDVCRATGREPELTAGHDGVLVADVVAEWAGRHARPYRLRLTGPAGGAWSSGEPPAGDDLELDAVEFCRLLSGRGTGTGLLAQQVPF
ncbi:maleylpyruvate isomerase family mycothiol-dependent enzyme [Trujillonella humicola]|uniref:maleylpyruvate isomerase family mycothiol-dependent enzyme n=1 Tax=Trujillonella humicola TaxID=3383699 RepID=UPI0039066BF0